MYASEVHLITEQELFPPQIPAVVFLEDGDERFLSCSFEKPCFFCGDKYSIPDPVFCYGVLMGGIRRGKAPTPTPNYKVYCQQQEHHKTKLFSQEFSPIQEDASHGHHHDLLSSSLEDQYTLAYDDHKDSSSCPQTQIPEKDPQHPVFHRLPLTLF